MEIEKWVAEHVARKLPEMAVERCSPTLMLIGETVYALHGVVLEAYHCDFLNIDLSDPNWVVGFADKAKECQQYLHCWASDGQPSNCPHAKKKRANKKR